MGHMCAGSNSNSYCYCVPVVQKLISYSTRRSSVFRRIMSALDASDPCTTYRSARR